jgi:cyclophilin family peptidyl-prolyl cis-trans isomerase
MTMDQFEEWLNLQAAGIGLDASRFASDLKSTAIVQKVEQAQQEADRIGIPSTPFLLINGRAYTGPTDLANLDAIVKLIQLEKRQFTACPPMQIDPQKQYLATVKTEKGDITIQLYADKAPMTVNSFVFLARNGWFDGITFHRVDPEFVAQTGDPSGTGYGTPGYAFDNEIAPGLAFDKPGVVAMANAGPNSNGSQFFITYGPAESLDGKYTVFGQVIQGMDVVQKLTPRNPTAGGSLPPGDKILSVTIEEK